MHLLEDKPRVPDAPERARAWTYQNVHIENVPSAPLSPSGDAAGS